MNEATIIYEGNNLTQEENGYYVKSAKDLGRDCWLILPNMFQNNLMTSKT
ncbi:hypothetical protein ACDX78_17500 [Virgibacillus oceani]